MQQHRIHNIGKRVKKHLYITLKCIYSLTQQLSVYLKQITEHRYNSVERSSSLQICSQ